MEITIKVTGLDQLAGAINALAASMAGAGSDKSGNVNPAQPMRIQTTATQGGTVANVQASPAQPMRGVVVPIAQNTVQTAPTQAAPTAIPTTTAPAAYTTDALAVAASQLVNAGKQQRLIEILNGLGAQTLMDLPKERYGAFAAALKGEGVSL